MTCTAPRTGCGFEAPDPLDGVETSPGACSDPVNPERYITLQELASHPKGCQVTGHEDLARFILDSVSSAVDDHYGRSIAPCIGARCFGACGCDGIDIDLALRVDEVEVGSCACGAADQTWTAVDLCDVVVWSPSDNPPYRRLTGLGLCGCGSSQVRVTGVWGDVWPIRPAIKAAVITVAAKLLLVSKESGKIVANQEDGATSYMIPDFSMKELVGLLPRSLVRYYGAAV